MRGTLSAGPNSNIDLDFVGLLTESVDLHFYISDDEKRRMFPVDPDIGRAHVTSTVHRAPGGQFYDGVAKQDERKCLITKIMELLCDAVHLLAHSKSDEVCYPYSRIYQ